MLSERIQSVVAWTSYHRNRLLVAAGLLVAATVGVVVLVFARTAEQDGRPGASTSFPIPEDAGNPNVGLPRPVEPGFVVPAEGACLELLSELRNLFATVESGVLLKGDDLTTFNELNATVDGVCPAEVASTFRSWELVPWLRYVPEPDVVAGARPKPTPTSIPASTATGAAVPAGPSTTVPGPDEG